MFSSNDRSKPQQYWGGAQSCSSAPQGWEVKAKIEYPQWAVAEERWHGPGDGPLTPQAPEVQVQSSRSRVAMITSQSSDSGSRVQLQVSISETLVIVGPSSDLGPRGRDAE